MYAPGAHSPARLPTRLRTRVPAHLHLRLPPLKVTATRVPVRACVWVDPPGMITHAHNSSRGMYQPRPTGSLHHSNRPVPLRSPIHPFTCLHPSVRPSLCPFAYSALSCLLDLNEVTLTDIFFGETHARAYTHIRSNVRVY